ncbi:probable DNA primase large subunit [Henckelia pumila]|uniref:probable DNA primase large subunit n=1 Tax=Henckelia pumila TaxID=405737 RepID=UPI003C6DDF09
MSILVKELWRKNMMQVEASETVNKDVISHFVLRLVYCIEEELRKWFLSIESTLFCYRFQLETPEAQRALLVEFDLPYKAVSSAEYESIKDKLNQVVRSNGKSLSNGRKQGAASPCAACKLLRRRCMQDCVFSPYFPADEPHKFASFHKVFGASNVNKMFQGYLVPKKSTFPSGMNALDDHVHRKGL